MEGMIVILVIIAFVLWLSKRKKKAAKPVKRNVGFTGEDLTRLTKDGELPFGWFTANSAFIKEREAEFNRFNADYHQAKGQGALKEYAAVKSMLMYMEDVKRLCASKGECFEFWATFMVADPQIMDGLRNRKKFLEDNMDTLLKKEQQGNK